MRLARPRPPSRRSASVPAPARSLRLVAILVVAVLLQTTVAPNFRILGANPDFALDHRRLRGTCSTAPRSAPSSASSRGMFVAIALMEPFGLSAFVFVLVGFLVGRYAETADLSAGVAPLFSAFVATLLANVLFATAQYLLAPRGAARLLPGSRPRPVSHPQHAAGRAHLYLVVRFWLRGAGDLRVARAR